MGCWPCTCEEDRLPTLQQPRMPKKRTLSGPTDLEATTGPQAGRDPQVLRDLQTATGLEAIQRTEVN